MDRFLSLRAPDLSGFDRVLSNDNILMLDGSVTLSVDATGALSTLRALGRDWASAARPLCLLVYQTFGNGDWDDFASNYVLDDGTRKRRGAFSKEVPSEGAAVYRYDRHIALQWPKGVCKLRQLQCNCNSIAIAMQLKVRI
jgi:hypothetical protein